MSSPFLRHVPLVLWCGVSLALAQQTQTAPVVPSPPPQTPAPAQKPPEEMVQKEQPALFQARVSLVAVPVVVRDKAGKAVGNLKKEDFQLFDRGKPQFIARFSMEKAGTRVINPVVVEAADPTAGAVQGKPMEVADGFTALLFDDVHGEFADLARARDAAQKYIDNSLKASERFAIYTTSGQTIQDFTDDRVLLKATLLKLMPRPVTGQGGRSCPEIDLLQRRPHHQQERSSGARSGCSGRNAVHEHDAGGTASCPADGGAGGPQSAGAGRS